MDQTEVQALEMQIMELSQKLATLRKDAPSEAVDDYEFNTLEGTTKLTELFGEHDKLLVIHNMGQGCRYCTVWGDGLNGFLPHLEHAMSVVVVSKDSPETQRRFANERGWRFRMASHGGGKYLEEHIRTGDYKNTPGAAVYERKDGKILKTNTCMFGPGDLYCSLWHFLGLAGIDAESFTPQFNYWRRPEKLEDGGQNVEY